ncbi:MAG: hypothetical protein FJ087_04740 [Deltaproteobacteria bacterium]|nr:hypothetical protein [Deltaproteobacteria bacterium]
MTRDEAAGKVLDYVYGEMSPEAAAEFERLIGNDPGLAAEVESVRSVRRAVAVLPRAELPGDVRRSLVHAAKRRIAARRREHRLIPEWLERFLLSPAFSGAMVVVVALAAGTHIVGRFDAGEGLATVEDMERAEASRRYAAPLARAQGAEVPAGAEAAPAAVVPPTADPSEAAPAPAAQPRAVAVGRYKADGDLGTRDDRAGERATAARREFAEPPPAGVAEAPAALGAVARGRPAPLKSLDVDAPGWGHGTEGGMFLDGTAAGGTGVAGASGTTSATGAGKGGGAVATATPAAPVPAASMPDRAAASAPAASPAPALPPAAHAAGYASAPMAEAGNAEPAADESVNVEQERAGAPSRGGGDAEHRPGAKAKKEDAKVAGDKLASAEEKDQAETPAATLDRARRLKAAGARAAALDAYRAAIAGLTGNALRAALREAADLAEAMGRTEVARTWRDRLLGLDPIPPAAAPAEPAAPAKGVK